MVIVDSSVWVSHLREGSFKLENLLNKGEVVCHQFIVGEIACGKIKNRTEIIELLQRLPKTIMATHEEVIEFINTNKLMGKGLGYIDMHLLASAILTAIPLWTFDRKLDEIAKGLGVGYTI